MSHVDYRFVEIATNFRLVNEFLFTSLWTRDQEISILDIASYVQVLIVWLCLQLTQMPRSPELVIFVPMTDDNRQTKPITLPLAYVRGVL